MQPFTDTVPDSALLEAYAEKRDEAAFSELVRRHLGLVHSAIRRQVEGAPEVSEDLSQKVFMELARKSASLSRHPTIAGWLYTTSRRMAADWMRREGRRQRREREMGMECPDEATASDPGPSWSRISSLLDASMHELPEADRLAILLRYFERRPFAEVGKQLGLSENAARMRVERALDKLRTVLRRRGVTLHECGLGGLLVAGAVLPAPSALGTTVSAVALGSSGSLPLGSSVAIPLAGFMKTKVAMVMLLAGAAFVPWVMQYPERRALDLENQSLKLQLIALQKRVDMARPASGLTPMPSEGRLDSERSELLRLRGEVGRLRRELAERKPADSGGVEPDSRKQKPSGRLFLGEEIRDVGSATPERALTSLIWATTTGKPERLAEFLQLPATVPDSDSARHYQFIAKQLGTRFAEIEFSSVQSIQAEPDGGQRIILGYLDAPAGRTNYFPFRLRQGDSGWRVVVEGEVPPDF